MNEPSDTVISMRGLVGADVVVVALGLVVVGVNVTGDLLGLADGLVVVGLVVIVVVVVEVRLPSTLTRNRLGRASPVEFVN